MARDTIRNLCALFSLVEGGLAAGRTRFLACPQHTADGVRGGDRMCQTTTGRTGCAPAGSPAGAR
ncbi:hypothetical protein GCM10009613_18590 [Pseudonocardia kongjuensis]|uniref:Uncharacterized protein n=1 Tax=Pseudonocardia kongjuensis TaxID=102227 RepID=A0ABP4IAG0_9PSEU